MIPLGNLLIFQEETFQDRNIKKRTLKKILIFQEMELSSPMIKNFLVFQEETLKSQT